MGDHSCHIKIEFSIHNKTYKQEWYINYFDNGDGIDRRIVEWFAECWHDAHSRWQESVDEYFKEEREHEIEETERTELLRLLEKYPGYKG